MALTGLTTCKLYYAESVAAKSGIPGGLSDGDRVLCAGEGSPRIAHAANGVYIVGMGAWTFEAWDPATVPAPHVDVVSAQATAGHYKLTRIGAGTRVDRL